MMYTYIIVHIRDWAWGIGHHMWFIQKIFLLVFSGSVLHIE